jgi:predicted nucleic acid-binding protein
MNVLVDTSVWSLALRRKREDLNAGEKALVAELNELIREGRVRMLGIIRQELLSGIQNADQYEKLRRNLRAYPDEAIETTDYESAVQGSNECRSKGVAVSGVDVLICAATIRRGWPIFTTDPDFQRYARILPIQLHTPRR